MIRESYIKLRTTLHQVGKNIDVFICELLKSFNYQLFFGYFGFSKIVEQVL